MLQSFKYRAHKVVCRADGLLLQAAARSFSLVYMAEKEGAQRTLDLTCQTHQDFELWFCGLQVPAATFSAR